MQALFNAKDRACARAMGISLIGPDEPQPHIIIHNLRVELEQAVAVGERANETTAHAIEAYKFVSASRDKWRRRWVCTFGVLMWVLGNWAVLVWWGR